MSTHNRRSALIIGLLLLAVAVALALLLVSVVSTHAEDSPPSLSLTGTVTIDGVPVPAGTLIQGLCGGNTYRSAVTWSATGASWYAMEIPSDDPATPDVKEGCAAADTVYFYILGGIADQTTVFQNGSLQLNLTRSLTWDKSTLTLTGRCLASGEVEYTVTNGGRAMTGPTEWQLYGTPTLMAGVFQLPAGGTQTWKFGPFGNAIDFAVTQRPNHPGSSQPHLLLSCQPTAIGLRTFTATALSPLTGNRGGCGRGNSTTVSCNVTDAGPGFVSGSCDLGYWFSRVSTARTFVIGQIVTVRGCEGLNQELYAPIRITR